MKRIIIAIFLLSLVSQAQESFQKNNKPQKLVQSPDQHFMNPRWSPDGSKIAFTSIRYKGLWVVESDGTNLLHLSDDPAAGFGFSWSPDSRHILFRAAKYDENRRLNAVKQIDVIAQVEKQLTDYRSVLPGLPEWFGTNGEIAFFNGKGLEILGSGIGLQNSGQQKIAYIKNGNIVVTTPLSKALDTLKPLQGANYINTELSPDNKKIAFEQIGGNLYIMDTDGHNLKEIGPGHRPQWSADSRYITYMITQDDGHDFTASDIYISSADGKFKQQITETDNRIEMNPSWSPDGSKIIFDNYLDGVIYILIITTEEK